MASVICFPFDFQDEHPPIPDSLSPDITDFLRQCFKKVGEQIFQSMLFIQSVLFVIVTFVVACLGLLASSRSFTFVFILYCFLVVSSPFLNYLI